MLKKIPSFVLEINEKFREMGFEIYLIGGCVRDLLHGRKVKDWDFATNATPEQMLALFPDAFYDNKYGTVGIPEKINMKPEESEKEKAEIPHENIVEVTTFRTETGYKDRRHPEVEWGKTIEEDLGRRDFTINAIALKISGSNNDIVFIDPYNGQEDIKNKIIRAVGDPDLRFKEDALRLMRAIRLAAQLGYTIEENTLTGVIRNAALLAEISKERVRDELLKILASDYPYEGVMMLKNTGLMQYIIPELLEGIGVSQARPGRHHKEDVFSHNVLSLQFCTSTDPVVRFAALLHDIGKPRVASKDSEGYVVFHNHEMVGQKIAGMIADRLRFPRKEKLKIMNLIRWHMFSVDEHITDAAVRRFIRRVGEENVQNMMDLRIGDRLGGGTQTAESWRLKLFKKRIEEQFAPKPFSVNDLAVDGHDIMRELNIKPGPKIGQILQKLFEEADEDLEKNNKEYLIKKIKELGFMKK